jgi:hypothetical protein
VRSIRSLRVAFETSASGRSGRCVDTSTLPVYRVAWERACDEAQLSDPDLPLK